jgi:hypothetical protein
VRLTILFVLKVEDDRQAEFRSGEGIVGDARKPSVTGDPTTSYAANGFGFWVA